MPSCARHVSETDHVLETRIFVQRLEPDRVLGLISAVESSCGSRGFFPNTRWRGVCPPRWRSGSCAQRPRATSDPDHQSLSPTRISPSSLSHRPHHQSWQPRSNSPMNCEPPSFRESVGGDRRSSTENAFQSPVQCSLPLYHTTDCRCRGQSRS